MSARSAAGLATSLARVLRQPWVGALLVAAAAAWASDAEACTCGRPSPLVLPKDGSTSVPTNVKFHFGPGQGEVALLAGQTTVATFKLGSAMQRVGPPALLAPQTDYQLLHAGGEYPERLTFRTGAGPALTRPVLADFDFTPYATPAFITIPPASCGRRESIVFRPMGGADDSTPPDQLTYDFFYGPTPTTVDLAAERLMLGPAPALGEGLCGPQNFPLISSPRVSGALAVVDWAGNRSAPTQVQVLKGCGCSTGASAAPLAALLALCFRRRVVDGRGRRGR